jgi:uncharacterized membrane protein
MESQKKGQDGKIFRMGQFTYEALFIGVKEGAKLSLCIFVILSFFRNQDLGYLRKAFFTALGVVSFISFFTVTSEVTLAVRDVIVKMIGYVFGVFYLLSLAALYHETVTDLLGPLRRVFGNRVFLAGLTFLLTALYFSPDMTGSSLYLADIFAMSGSSYRVFLVSGVGFFASLTILYVLLRRMRFNLKRIVGLPQLLLFLSLIKLIAGGVRGFAELSLIPAVQQGLMKLIHDMVHQTFLFIMVPDHPLLTVTTWDFIAVFFGDIVAMWLSLFIIVLPLAMFVRKHFSEEIQVPPEVSKSALRRKFIKAIRDERVLKSIPVFVFMVFILGTWFVQRTESVTRLYNPEPKPVVAEGGMVTIPIRSPAKDLLDGALHKFSVNIGVESVRFMVMKKPDGTLSVSLDACEICPPDGYAQGEGHVICLYCRTPIAVDTLGDEGGCNPIPLRALITEKEIKIEVSEISGKWNRVKTGETKEQVGR